MKRVWLTVVTAALVIVLDAASKAWALQNLQMGQTRPFIPGILQLTLTTNTGGAFGIGSGAREIMTLLPIVICSAIIYVLYRRQTKGPALNNIEQVGFGMLLGGAIGNIIDRLLQGRVTDFLEFAFVSFPIFNVADALIDVGLVLLVLNALRSESTVPSAQPQANE